MMPKAVKKKAAVDHRVTDGWHDRPVPVHRRKRKKSKKALWRKALSEAVDILEDIFD